MTSLNDCTSSPLKNTNHHTLCTGSSSQSEEDKSQEEEEGREEEETELEEGEVLVCHL